MRLGSKTDDEFLIKLNEKNNQIQTIFHVKIKEIAKKHLVDVMMQDGTVKKQETFDVCPFCILDISSFVPESFFLKNI